MVKNTLVDVDPKRANSEALLPTEMILTKLKSIDLVSVGASLISRETSTESVKTRHTNKVSEAIKNNMARI